MTMTARKKGNSSRELFPWGRTVEVVNSMFANEYRAIKVDCVDFVRAFRRSKPEIRARVELDRSKIQKLVVRSLDLGGHL